MNCQVVSSEVIEVQSLQNSKGWKCIKVKDPLDSNLTGILASISDILRKANIRIFAISTFDKDYILVRTHDFLQPQSNSDKLVINSNKFI